MAAWSLYGVFAGSKWGMTTNKREALRAAKEHKGYVRLMAYPRDTHYWDPRTFIVCSDPLADFRAEEERVARHLLDGLSSAPIA